MMTVDGQIDFFAIETFMPATVLVNAPSHLTFTIFRGGNGGAGFTDTLPLGLIASNVTTNCELGTISTNGTSITTSLGLAFAGSCTVEADVVAAAPGVYINVMPPGTVTGFASIGDPFFYHVTNGDAITATVTVVAPNPVVTKSFAAPVTTIGTPNRMTITITNPNPAAAITSVALSDAYPTNLKNAPAPNATTTCGGTLTAAAGATSLTLGGATIAAGSSCTISLDVLSDIAGSYTNTIASGGATSSAGANTVPASASMMVRLNAPSIAKSFADPQAVAGAPDRLTITLTNPNTAAITGVAFTDFYPANLFNATPLIANTNCSGVLTAIGGGNSVALSGGTIAASGNCTVSIDLTSATPGSYTNTMPPGSVTSSNAQPNALAASAAVIVATPMPALSHRMLLLLAMILCAIAVLRLRT